MFSKAELKMLNEMSDANFCFFICEKLVEIDIHICDNSIVTASGEDFENNTANLKFFIERLIYKSDMRFHLKRDLEATITNNKYIFQMEMSSSDALVAMLGK